MRDHALIEELLTVRALGAIDPDDDARLRDEMARHGDCEECGRLARETTEAAGRLAFALDPVPVGHDLEERTVARLRDERPSPGATPWVRPLVAAVAAALLFAGGWLAGRATGGGTPFPLEDGRVAAFQGSGSGNLALVYRPGERGLYLIGSDLAEPVDGITYELWLFRDGTPVRAGCFEPSDGGILRFVDVSLGGAETAAVTRESTACPTAPTTEPLFTATL